MRIIKIHIERSSDFFCAYSNIEDGLITGGGFTVKKCRQDVLDCIQTLKSLDKRNRPKFLDSPFKLVFVKAYSSS